MSVKSPSRYTKVLPAAFALSATLALAGCGEKTQRPQAQNDGFTTVSMDRYQKSDRTQLFQTVAACVASPLFEVDASRKRELCEEAFQTAYDDMRERPTISHANRQECETIHVGTCPPLRRAVEGLPAVWPDGSSLTAQQRDIVQQHLTEARQQHAATDTTSNNNGGITVNQLLMFYMLNRLLAPSPTPTPAVLERSLLNQLSTNRDTSNRQSFRDVAARPAARAQAPRASSPAPSRLSSPSPSRPSSPSSSRR